MAECIFCKIVAGKIPAKKVAETDDILAFYDNKPSAQTHILIIPKQHMESFLDIEEKDSEVFSEMLRLAQNMIKENKIERKYKLVINGGEYQFVPHLHLHLLGGELKEKV